MSGLVRAALRSSSAVFAPKRVHGFPMLTQQSAVCFSTEAQQPPENSTAPPPFMRDSNTGLTYARLHGIHRNILKTDIINYLEGCNLSLHDVKMEYSRGFLPIAMMLQFPSQNDYRNASSVIIRKGRLYKLEMVDSNQWDIVTPYDGKTILIQGIPRNAQFVDIERILSGCEYDHSSVNVFSRLGEGSEPIRMATVRFPSRTQALNAFIAKNGTFCLNNRVFIQVLQ